MTLPKTRKEQEIWQACDDLLAVGKTMREITGEAIAVRLRELRYKAGSSNERYKYRDSWMAARGLSREEQGRGAVEISDPIARAATLFRDGLERELRLEYEQKYQQLEQALTDKVAELNAMSKSAETLQTELVLEKEAHQLLQQQYAIKTRDYQELHEKNIGFQLQIKEFEKQLAASQAIYDASLSALKQQQSDMKSQFEKFTNELTDSHEQRLSDVKEAAEAQRHRLIVDIDTYRVSEVNLREELSKQKVENDILKQQLTAMQPLEKQLALLQQHLGQLDKAQLNNQGVLLNSMQKFSQGISILPEFQAGLEVMQKILNNLCHKLEATELMTQTAMVD